jgi:protein tyrosine phosphatase (PTP) superfamily phosphohydrolase (DUF442 family)
MEVEGLHNVFRVTEKLYSGSAPEGKTGFSALQRLGVKTVISVDGAQPDLKSAREFGLHHVHLPVGYDGISRDQALRLAKAVKELPGPIYIHCHHGQHRGPAAAAVVRLCLDQQCTAAMAVEVMKRAGTDPRYQGLFDAPRKIVRPTMAELAALPADFPETSPVALLTQAMAAIDRHWDHLIQVRAVGWNSPPEHPDIDPAHEALQVVEHYREVVRLPKTRERPEEFRRLLDAAEKAAVTLRDLLERKPNNDRVTTARVEQAFQQSKAACTQCHAKFRDGPPR